MYLFLRHQTTTGRICVRQFHEPGFLATVYAQIHCDTGNVAHEPGAPAHRLEQEIPIGHCVHAVPAEAMETQFFTYRFAVDTEDVSAQGPSAQGAYVQILDYAP